MRLRLGGLLLAFVALSSTYNLINPLFEAPDEVWHYHYVRSLAEGRGLPREDPDRSDVLGQAEAAQPPLYYAAAALLTFWAPRGDLAALAVNNPIAGVGVPTHDANNRNHFLHGPDQGFPWSGEVLTVHLVRFTSTLWGALAVLLTFLIGRAVFASPGLALAAAATVAFTPEFLYESAAVSNDTAVAALAALVLLLAIRASRRPPTARRSALLGVAAGLAVLAKPLALGALVLAVVALIWSGWRARVRASALLVPVVLLGLAFVATCGWWFAHNVRVYGSPVPLATFTGRALGSAPARFPPLNDLVGELRGLDWSYWALFGWFNVLAPAWYYRLFDALGALAALGLLVALARAAVRPAPTRPDGALALVALWAATAMGSLAAYRFVVMAFQGRLLFPGIAAFAVLLVLGWSSLVPSRLKVAGAGLAAAALIVPAALAPWDVLRPAYAPTPALAVGTVAPSIPLGIRFGDQVRLLGVDLDPAPGARLRPGDDVTVTLYLEALRPIPENYLLGLHLTTLAMHGVGGVDTHPQQGRFPTASWSPGTIVVDRYRVRIDPAAATPAALRMTIALYRFGDPTGLPGYDARGRKINGLPSVGPWVIVGGSNLDRARNGIVFDDTLSLVGADLPDHAWRPGDEVVGHLLFGSVRQTLADFTVFVHLVDEDGKIVAGDDAQAARGAFPTSFWRPGDLVDHEFRLLLPPDLAPGTYRVKTGWYELASGKRLGSPRGDEIDVGAVVVR